MNIHFLVRLSPKKTVYSWLLLYLHIKNFYTQAWWDQNIQLPILTYSMAQSPSWETNWFASGQEIPRISRNPKVHYRTHKHPPPVSILGQPKPVHIPTSHLLEIHRNIIHPSMPRSPQWSLSLRFPHQDPIHSPSPHPYAPHAQPISFFSILSSAQYWVRSTNHLVSRYGISSTPPLPRPCMINILL